MATNAQLKAELEAAQKALQDQLDRQASQAKQLTELRAAYTELGREHKREMARIAKERDAEGRLPPLTEEEYADMGRPIRGEDIFTVDLPPAPPKPMKPYWRTWRWWSDKLSAAALAAVTLAILVSLAEWLDKSGQAGLVLKMLDFALASALVLGLVVCVRRGPLQGLVMPHADEMEAISWNVDRSPESWIPVAVNNGLWGAGILIAIALVSGVFS